MLLLQHVFRSIASFVQKRITFLRVLLCKKEKIHNAQLLLLKHGAVFLHRDTLCFILTCTSKHRARGITFYTDLCKTKEQTKKPIVPNFPSANTYHKQKHYQKKKKKIEVSLPRAKKETRIGAVETKCVEKLVVAACPAL